MTWPAISICLLIAAGLLWLAIAIVIARRLARAFAQMQRAHDEQSRRVEADLRRGVRLTDHRIRFVDPAP